MRAASGHCAHAFIVTRLLAPAIVCIICASGCGSFDEAADGVSTGLSAVGVPERQQREINDRYIRPVTDAVGAGVDATGIPTAASAVAGYVSNAGKFLNKSGATNVGARRASRGRSETKGSIPLSSVVGNDAAEWVERFQAEVKRQQQPKKEKKLSTF